MIAFTIKWSGPYNEARPGGDVCYCKPSSMRNIPFIFRECTCTEYMVLWVNLKDKHVVGDEHNGIFISSSCKSTEVQLSAVMQ